MQIINDKLNNNRISLFFQEYYLYDNLYNNHISSL